MIIRGKYRRVFQRTKNTYFIYEASVLIASMSIILHIMIFIKILNPNLTREAILHLSINITEFNHSKSFISEAISYAESNIGRIDWFHDPETPNLIKKHISTNCSLCDMNSTAEFANSSPRDVILGLIYGNKLLNFLTLIRSIRSTGCKASIVVMISVNATSNMTQIYRKHLEDCGVTLLSMPDFFRVNGIHGNLLRHLFFALFVNMYEKDFDRVIILDIYDTIFQRDPFNEDFSLGKVQFSYETVKYSKNRVNLRWLKAIDPKFKKSFYYRLYPICSGLFGGTTTALIKFYRKYVNLSYWEWINTKCQDQGLLNYLWYHHKLDDVMYVDFKHHLVSAYCSDFSWEYSEKGFTQYKDGTVPAVMHQYDRRGPPTLMIMKACPVLGEWQITPYAKHDYTKFPK